jgi:hypothetical protein
MPKRLLSIDDDEEILDIIRQAAVGVGFDFDVVGNAGL